MRRVGFDPFILVLLATVGLATALPANGIALTVVNALANAAVVLLFFLYGVRLARAGLTAALTHARLHAAVLGSTFILYPLLGIAFSTLAPTLLPSSLWLGVLFMCALPSTVQSSIAFTSIARGNVGAAITAAALSNLSGIALTPLLISWLTHVSGGGISWGGLGKLVLLILLPFAIGHACRPALQGWAERQKPLLAITDRMTIVLALYSAFSAATLAGLWVHLSMASLLILGVVCASLLGIMLTLTRFSARLCGLPNADAVAIQFCGSQKSLVSGVPMARALFAGPEAGVVILPLVLFHQIQLLTCAWLAPRITVRADAHTPSESEIS